MATAFDIKHGQIAVELARELKRTYTNDLRLVSRTPRKVNNTHKLVSANLLDAKQTLDAVEGSSIVYFTASLPPDTQRWEALFPTMLKNALDACRAAGASFLCRSNTAPLTIAGTLMQVQIKTLIGAMTRSGQWPTSTAAHQAIGNE